MKIERGLIFDAERRRTFASRREGDEAPWRRFRVARCEGWRGTRTKAPILRCPFRRGEAVVLAALAAKVRRLLLKSAFLGARREVGVKLRDETPGWGDSENRRVGKCLFDVKLSRRRKEIGKRRGERGIGRRSYDRFGGKLGKRGGEGRAWM